MGRGNEIPRAGLRREWDRVSFCKESPRTLIKSANPAEVGDSRREGSMCPEEVRKPEGWLGQRKEGRAPVPS